MIASTVNTNIHAWCDKSSQYTLVAIGFFLPISTAVTNVLFVLTALLVLLGGQFKEKMQFLRAHPVTLQFLGFWFLFFIGCFYTKASVPEALAVLIKHDKFIYSIAFLWLFQHEKLAKYAILAFLFSMSFCLCLIWAKHFGVISICSRLVGHAVVFKHHIHLSFLITWFVFLVAVLGVFFKKIHWIYFVFACCGLVFLIFFNTGRSGYLVLSVLAVLLGMYRLGAKGAFFIIAGLMLVGSFAYHVSPYTQSRIDMAAKEWVNFWEKDKAYSSIGLRLYYWQHGIDAIEQHPLLGQGTGSAAQHYRHVTDDKRFHTNNPHNEYINIAMQLGVVGLGYFLWMLFSQWRQSRYLPRHMRLLLQGLLLAMMTSSLVNSSWSDTVEGHLYVYWIALLMARVGDLNDSSPTNKKAPQLCAV